jgi:hypothetical protein
MTKRSLKLPSCYELAVSSRETYVAALGRDVVVANLTSGERFFSSRALAHPAHAAFSGDETQMVVKNTSGDMLTLDVSDGLRSPCICRMREKMKRPGNADEQGSAIPFPLEALMKMSVFG